MGLMLPDYIARQCLSHPTWASERMEGGREEGREEGESAARRESVPETSVQEGKSGGEESMIGMEGNANGEATAREGGEVSGGEEGSKIAFGSILITHRKGGGDERKEVEK